MFIGQSIPNEMKKAKNILVLFGQIFLIIVALAGSVNGVPTFITTIINFLPTWIWITLLVLSLPFSSYYFLRKNPWVKKIIYGRDERIRIAILLPLNHNDDFVREDAELQLQGFGKSLSEIREDLKSYDLKFLDHQSDPKFAKEIIIKELKRGTKYFICTMSSVCIELSKEFPELDKKFGEGKAVLVCTVAGADEIVTTNNSVYRFYINLKDEIYTLLSNINGDKKKAGIIYFNSPYAKSCANLFQSEWNKRNRVDQITGNHKIELKVQKRSEINNKLSTYNSTLSDRDVIFIVAYGSSYIQILETLEAINKNALIVMTSTFSFKHYAPDVMKILNHFEWLSCKPVLKREEFRNDEDVVTYFSMHTLEKIVKVIKATNDDISKFDVEWNKNTIPNKLTYTAIAGKDGDYKIELTAKNKSSIV